MAKSRATFGKLQRERDKKAKAADKRERRVARPSEAESQATATNGEPSRDYDEGRLLEALAALHQSFESGTMSADEFELRREELTSRIRVD